MYFLYIRSEIEWNAQRCELVFRFESVRPSNAPWQNQLREQAVQMIWIDKDLMVTKQSNEKISNPDIYTLWKRMKPTVYNKY